MIKYLKNYNRKGNQKKLFGFMNFSLTNIKEVDMSKLHIFLSITFLLFLTVASYAQTVLNFDGTASQWVTSTAAPANTFSLSDNFDDYEEGIGSLEIRTEIAFQGASWGTWTDAKYNYASAQNWTGTTDLRLKVKILQNPVHNRSLQFTLDLVDSSTQGQELWRYMEDLDFLYHFNVDAVNLVDGWHDLVIPLNDPANSLTVADNFDDYVEGIGSHQVTAILNVFHNTWGTWTDAKWTFPALVDLTGPTELRFWMKIIDPAERSEEH